MQPDDLRQRQLASGASRPRALIRRPDRESVKQTGRSHSAAPRFFSSCGLRRLDADRAGRGARGRWRCWSSSSVRSYQPKDALALQQAERLRNDLRNVQMLAITWSQALAHHRGGQQLLRSSCVTAGRGAVQRQPGDQSRRTGRPICVNLESGLTLAGPGFDLDLDALGRPKNGANFIAANATFTITGASAARTVVVAPAHRLRHRAMKRRSGFSIIELVIVIVVVAIAAVAIGSAFAYISRSQRAHRRPADARRRSRRNAPRTSSAAARKPGSYATVPRRPPPSTICNALAGHRPGLHARASTSPPWRPAARCAAPAGRCKRVEDPGDARRARPRRAELHAGELLTPCAASKASPSSS